MCIWGILLDIYSKFHLLEFRTQTDSDGEAAHSVIKCGGVQH